MRAGTDHSAFPHIIIHSFCISPVSCLLFCNLHITHFFLFRLSAYPVLFFPVVYVMAARDPARRPWAVSASILFRIAGGSTLLVLTLQHHPPGESVYMGVAIFDVILGLTHAILAKKNPPTQGDASG